VQNIKIDTEALKGENSSTTNVSSIEIFMKR